MPVMIAAGIGAVSSLIGGRSAKKAQREAIAVQREQLQFARDQDAWMKNTLFPEMQQDKEQLQGYADQYGGQMGMQAGRDMDLAQMFGDRLKNTFMPLEDQIVAEARDAGGDRDQAFESDRALTDVRQNYANQRAQAVRTGRAYGGDINRLMAAQADNDPMAALAEATGQNRARQMAKSLGFDKRMKAADLGKMSYTSMDAAGRRAISGIEGAFGISQAPAKFGLESARIMGGVSGQVGDMYNSAGRNSAYTASSMGNSASMDMAGAAKFIGDNFKNFSMPSWMPGGGGTAIPTNYDTAGGYAGSSFTSAGVPII